MATDIDYDVLERIGHGSFGVIHKVRRKSDGEILCRKEISYRNMSQREKDQLSAELHILETLRHPNIVRYHHRHHLKSTHDLHLYMEYCGNGDLGSYIKNLKKRKELADEDFIWEILAQLVGALYRCHNGEDPPSPGKEGGLREKPVMSKKGYTGHTVILHRDLKPENVFLGDNNSVKLGDFGLSKMMASNDLASTYVGTPYYMSPEICAGESYSHHSDIWSVGCIIYELATQHVPFEARSQHELVLKIKNAFIKPLPNCYSKELNDVISACLKVNPRLRPNTGDLLNYPKVKAARKRLETRDVVDRLNAAQRQIVELQAEVSKLRESNKKVEMELYARANLVVDQRVQEITKAHKADLDSKFEQEVNRRAEEKLALHLSSLPGSHNASQSSASSVHVRSSTPPAGGKTSSAMTSFTSTLSDIETSSDRETCVDSVLDTEITTLSLHDNMAEEDEFSPLARRNRAAVAPKKATRKPLARAKTLGNVNFNNTGAMHVSSPMDTHMQGCSPMRPLSHSSRRNATQNHSEQQQSQPLNRNIFNRAAQQKENRSPIRGKTLLELRQSPMKWIPSEWGDDMPSPFIKRR